MPNDVHQLKGQDAVIKYTKALEYLLFVETISNKGRIQITQDGFVQKPILGNIYKSVSPAEALANLSNRIEEGVKRLDIAPSYKTSIIERIYIRDNPFVQEFEQLIGVYADELGETASFNNIAEYIRDCSKEQKAQDRREAKIRQRKWVS